MGPSAKALSFDHTLSSPMPPDQVWSLLTQALSGEDQHGLWPTQYSTIGGTVAEGGLVTEVVFGRSTVRYRLTDVIPGQRLTYSPLPGEAMVGRSHIEVAPAAAGAGTVAHGSVLHWYGSYQVSALSPTGIVLRVYERLFFRALGQNLEKIAEAAAKG